MRALSTLIVLTTVLCAPAQAEGALAGEWITDLGLLTLQQEGRALRGTYGSGGGELEGALGTEAAELTWRQGQGSGTARLVFSEDGASFTGTWSSSNGGGRFNGWRKDPEAEKARAGQFSGLWLSSLGTMRLTQKGKRVEGGYGAEGWSSIEGEVRGRRLHLTWKRLQWSGPAWLELTPDGTRFFGLTEESPPTLWLGVKLEDYELHAKVKPGAFVQGHAENGMLYFLRVPPKAKRGKPIDTIVLLHGSNWTTKGMVHVVANRFPDLAERFAILGIQGQQWATWSDSDDLRFNYSYVNWMGKSTYEGFPHTDRESPYLIAQVLDELKQKYGLGRLFVGGHSQGGFLTYLLHMHYPEKWAGTFPMSAGLVMQAEPDVFKDDALRAAQRALPMAIIHGTSDTVVPFSTGSYCHERFLAHGFPAVRLLAPDSGHPFDFLPVDEAMRYLDALSTDDVPALRTFAAERAKAGEWRDVAAALQRARVLKAATKLADVERLLDEAASEAAAAHLAAIRANADGAWVRDYLRWQDNFEFATAAEPVVVAYRKLQAEHDPAAEQAITKAREAFRSGQADTAWALYQEVVDRYYAARQYRIVQRWLADRR